MPTPVYHVRRSLLLAAAGGLVTVLMAGVASAQVTVQPGDGYYHYRPDIGTEYPPPHDDGAWRRQQQDLQDQRDRADQRRQIHEDNQRMIDQLNHRN